MRRGSEFQVIGISRSTSGIENQADSAARRMSMQVRKTTAPPIARPLAAPIVTCGSDSKANAVRLPALLRMRSASGDDCSLAAARGRAVASPRPRSAPAEKARPAPVRITTRASASSMSSRQAAWSSWCMEKLMAFSFSGRFRVIVTSPGSSLSRSRRRVSIARMVRQCAARSPHWATLVRPCLRFSSPGRGRRAIALRPAIGKSRPRL